LDLVLPFLPAVFFLPILAAGPAAGAVVEAAPGGFLVRNETAIHASPDSVYLALTARVGGWWDPAHTYSGDSRNLALEARPGGCFCETRPQGGGVRHMEVVYAAPGQALRLVGALGPLQKGGLAGTLTWSLSAQGDSTRTVLEYIVGGYYPGGLTGIAPVVDEVLNGQLLRLKSLVETGRPGPP
jgi:hypothetical protein